MTIQTIEHLDASVKPKSVRKRLKRSASKICSKKSLQKRIPVLEWLPKYNLAFFIQDVVAGITVGLTAIPQGIAYAVIAGLPPEYGLYASLASGYVYMVFGSCNNVTVGPTAILATMIARYSNYSIEFAMLAALLTGIAIFLMGVFQLGFLVNFISTPVINGFTTAAALQIAASQLRSFFGLAGSSGNFFAESIQNFINNIRTANPWDSILAIVTVILLYLLKKLGEGCKRTDGFLKQMRWFISMSRNAVVVIFGMIVAYLIRVITDTEPLRLIGDIGSGLPGFGLPPFSVTTGNETYNFMEMLNILGPESIVLPLVAILEAVAIAKAFAESGRIDSTQEMIAIGLCNIVGSFFKSMPITGSFTRTALNHASGVQTQAGGVTKCLLIMAALSFLTSTFYYITSASLAGLIITAMFGMIDYGIFLRFWKHSKLELALSLITMLFSLFLGLEYGILAGVFLESLILLYNSSKPSIIVNVSDSNNVNVVTVKLGDNMNYSAAEYIRKRVVKALEKAPTDSVLIIEGSNVNKMDSTVATNLMNVIKEIDKTSRVVFMVNFKSAIVELCVDIYPKSENKFVNASKPLEIFDYISKSL